MNAGKGQMYSPDVKFSCGNTKCILNTDSERFYEFQQLHAKYGSEYVNTRPLARGDLILPADQWISNLLTWISDLILAAKFCHLKILRN